MSGTTMKRVKTFTVDLTDKPGDLATVVGACREAKVEMLGCWGWAMGDGKGAACFLAKEPAQFEATLKKLGRKYKQMDACWTEGADTLGVFNDLVQTAAKAGVNLHAANATGTAGKFCSVFFADEGQYDKMCKAFNC